MTTERTYRLKAQTDLWTGSVRLDERNGQLRERIVPDRLITTGLLGSIRWWFEVLVRGLGGSACDPSDTQCQDREHCVVCELFGCTGWARKFRFDVLEADCDKSIQQQIRKDTEFRLRFTALRPVREEEWALLDLTLRLIADYGAMGGKTALKPSDEPSRMNKPSHVDYGLVAVVQTPGLSRLPPDALRTYVGAPQWRRVDDSGVDWASIANFWFVGARYLARQNNNTSTFNRVVGRREPKAQAQQTVQGASAAANRWLAGRQQESKKIFSFKNPARTFGFVKPDVINFEDMRTRLRRTWPDLANDEFVEGTEILRRLTGSAT
jgi:CRISPR-associated protein Cmr1